MKAIICTQYGPPEVLELREIAKPAPKANEVLIKIHATSVTASDSLMRRFKFRAWPPLRLLMGLVGGIKKPRNPILGGVLAGEIEAVGKRVTRYKPGDQVYAMTVLRAATYAEYTCAVENSLMTRMPSNLSYGEAAAVPYSLIVLHCVKKADIQPGQKVLIYGASGSLGTTAVQLAKHFGAEVTGVCGPTNLELVKSLGASAVIDYTTEDFTQNGMRYDLILDAVGRRKARERASKEKCLNSLTPTGRYISVDDDFIPKVGAADLDFLRDLIEAGELKPVIDRSYPLEQMVEAHRYVDLGHKKGNVVITIEHAR